MKQLKISLRLLILISLLLGGKNTALSWWRAPVTVDGIKYDVYITGEKNNAVADSAYVAIGNNNFNGVANIASSVTYSYSWEEFIGYDSNHNPIYETITRDLSAKVIGIDGNYQSNKGAFRECTGLTGVTIPNTVITIRPNAFAGCI